MKIVVIEDDPKHLKDAKEFFQNKEIEVVFMTSFCGFRDYISRYMDLNKEVDFAGVISDIFFPYSDSGQTESIGVGVLMICQKLGIPCVLNTAGNHHGSRYQWISTVVNMLKLYNILVDMPFTSDADRTIEAPTKNWQSAYNRLVELIERKKS